MRRLTPIGLGAAMIALFLLSGGMGAVAHRDDDPECRRNPNCYAVTTTTTTLTVPGTATVTTTTTQTSTSTVTTLEPETRGSSMNAVPPFPDRPTPDPNGFPAAGSGTVISRKAVWAPFALGSNAT